MKLTKQEKDLLLRLLDTARIDAICGDNNLDQDELGYLMAKLGDESMQIVYKMENENTYKPKFFSCCKSYEEEEAEMRETIEGNPADVKLLKQEYERLTGKKYRRRVK